MFFTFCWQQLIKWTNLDCQLTLCNDFLPFGGILVLHLNHLWPCRCFPIIPPLISLQKTLDLPLFLVLFDQRRSSKTKALLSILHFPKQPPSLESSVSLLLLDPNQVKRSSSSSSWKPVERSFCFHVFMGAAQLVANEYISWFVTFTCYCCWFVRNQICGNCFIGRFS